MKKKLNLLLLSFLLIGCSNIDNNSSSKDNSIEVSSTNSSVEKETSSSLVVESSEEESSSIEQKESKKRVILIGVDGAGHNFTKDIAPCTTAIFKTEDSAKTFDCLTSNPTISAQCWGSMLTGLTPAKHGMNNSSISLSRNTTHPTIFKQAYEKIKEPVMASFVNWSPINYGIIEEGIGVYKQTNSDDNILSKMICDYLSNNDPDLLYVQFDSVDHAGHQYGFNTTKYYEAISNIDLCIADIYETLYNEDLLENTTFIVTADHGGSGYNHGGLTNDEKYTYVGIRGNNINNSTIKDMQVRDFPSIMAYALGIDANESWDSYIPQNLFKDNLTPATRNKQEEKIEPAKDTPNINGNNGLYHYFDSSTIDKALFFDDNLTDEKGSIVKEKGKVYFVDNAKYGKALNLNGDGYVNLENYRLSNSNNYTISSYINLQEYPSDDPVLFGNKNWDLGKNSGLVVAFRPNDIKLSIGYNGTTKVEAFYNYPVETKEWFHFMLSIDMEKREVNCYIDFYLVGTTKLTDSNLTISGNYDLNIGQDGTGNYHLYPNVIIDDFFIFKKAFTSDDVSTLKTYYDNI